MQGLYKNMAKVFLRVTLISILVALFLEIVFVTRVYYDGFEAWGGFFMHVWKLCFMPTIMTLVVYLVMYIVLDSPNIKSENKRYTTFIGITVICMIISIAYLDHVVLWGLFVVPIMFSAVYGETKYIRVATEFSVLCQLVVIVIRLFSDTELFEGISDGVIAILILFFAMFFSNIIASFVTAGNLFLEKQLERQATLSEQISIDAMTGLYNHTAFYDELDRLIKETDRTNEKLCIAVIDIDNFKSVNDTYGHSRGDEVLVYLSAVLKNVCKGQTICRYGGEEFSVIFTGTGLKAAVEIMERALEEFSNHSFEWCDRKITFSCGICQHYDIRINSEELFRQADKYLYKAKREGKNRIISE